MLSMCKFKISFPLSREDANRKKCVTHDIKGEDSKEIGEANQDLMTHCNRSY